MNTLVEENNLDIVKEPGITNVSRVDTTIITPKNTAFTSLPTGESAENTLENIVKGVKVEKKNEHAYIVTVDRVDLGEQKDPLQLELEVVKAPTHIEEGVSINSVRLEGSSPKLQEMILRARELRNIPEIERPRQIMLLLRANMDYAYSTKIDQLEKIDQAKAVWVRDNIQGLKDVSLSESIDSGWGLCQHLSVAMLVLGQEAGMEGAYMAYYADEKFPELQINNIKRTDSHEPLFKNIPLGDKLKAGHVWVELKTSKGNWIPVDPSTQLVGDTDEGRQMFRDANYNSNINPTLSIEGLPKNIGRVDIVEKEVIYAGDSETKVTILFNSLPISQDTMMFDEKTNEFYYKSEREKIDPPQSTSYTGPLDFTISENQTNPVIGTSIVIKGIH